MAIWQDVQSGNLYDDMEGEALLLPTWPLNLSKLTADQAQEVINQINIEIPPENLIIDPIDKLKQFLTANPDVAALIT